MGGTEFGTLEQILEDAAGVLVATQPFEQQPMAQTGFRAGIGGRRLGIGSSAPSSSSVRAYNKRPSADLKSGFWVSRRSSVARAAA